MNKPIIHVRSQRIYLQLERVLIVSGRENKEKSYHVEYIFNNNTYVGWFIWDENHQGIFKPSQFLHMF